MNDINSIKQTVMNLLSKAADGACSEAEANACMTKAHKLMAKFGLSEADMEKATGDDFVSSEHDARWSDKHGWIFHPVDRHIATVIAEFAGCKAIYRRDPEYKKHMRMRFFGLASDVQLAE